MSKTAIITGGNKGIGLAVAKDLISKKKETLKKERIAEGKFELNCKNGAFVNLNTNEVISTFTDEMNYLVNVNDFTYKNLNSKTNKIHQFSSRGEIEKFFTS